MQSGINHFRHKFGYIAAITSSRANHRGADRAEFTAGREQNRFNTTHSLIEVSHLEFVVEVATKSQPADDRVSSHFGAEVDQQSVNERHLDTRSSMEKMPFFAEFMATPTTTSSTSSAARVTMST